MKVQRILCFVLLLGVVTCSHALAQDTDVMLLRERIISLQNQYPLDVRVLVACSKVTGYGMYEPLPDNKVEAGDVIFFYYEPQNLATNIAEGTFEIWFTQDMFVLTEQMNEVFKKMNAFEIHEQTSSPRLDIYGYNQLTLTSIQTGRYVFKIVIHDNIKGEEASATWPFEVIQ